MIIVAALVALLQIAAARSGAPSPITVFGTSVASFAQSASSATIDAVRNGTGTIANLPQLTAENRALHEHNAALQAQNARLNELLNAYKEDASLQPVMAAYATAIPARVVGFPPENDSRTVTIDRGTRAGVHKNDGVIAARGVVGIVEEADPFTSKVVLLTDYTSRIPAVVREGRYWGIARGNLTSVRMEYVSQDAPLKVGDVVVTGEGRSFHSGEAIGTVSSIERSDASLYQTAVLRPAVTLGALDRVVVVPK